MVLVDIDIADKGDGNTYYALEGNDATGYLQSPTFVAYDYIGTVTTSYINIENIYNRAYNTAQSRHSLENFQRRGFLIFEGITIPQGSTIDNATLTFDVIPRQTSPVVQGTILARKTASPVTYVTTGVVGYGAENPLLGTGNFTKPVASATKTFTVPTTTATGVPFNPTTKAEDVQAIVQELVDAFDYNNDNMMFTIKAQDVAPKPPVTTTPTFNYNNAFYIMGNETGKATSNLTINYTAGTPTKDFTVDALIQALGANGTCATTEEQAPILDNIDIWDTQHNTSGSGTRVAHRWTPTVGEVAQLGTGITKITFWHGHTGGAGNFDTRIWSPASVGTTNETIIRSGGKFTFTGSSSAIQKRTRTLFDATGSFVQKWLPTAGVEYVFGMIENFPGTAQTRKNATDTISGVRTGRSGGNWADSSPEDLAVELIIAVAGGQHSCFTIDAQLIIAIPAQPFCINAILISPINQVCHEYTIDAILGKHKVISTLQFEVPQTGFLQSFIVDAVLKAIQTETFAISGVIENQKIVTTIWMEVPDADQKIEFTVDAVLQPSFVIFNFTIDASITPDIGIRRDVGDLIVRVLFENPPSLTGIEIIVEIVKITDAEPQWGFRGKVSRIKNWIGFLERTGVIEEDDSDPDWYETEWSLV